MIQGLICKVSCHSFGCNAMFDCCLPVREVVQCQAARRKRRRRPDADADQMRIMASACDPGANRRRVEAARSKKREAAAFEVGQDLQWPLPPACPWGPEAAGWSPTPPEQPLANRVTASQGPDALCGSPVLCVRACVFSAMDCWRPESRLQSNN